VRSSSVRHRLPVLVEPHDSRGVVRIDKTRCHEERLAYPARFVGADAQPTNTFARDKRIVVEAAEPAAFWC
jgi:hypothetical protein